MSENLKPVPLNPGDSLKEGYPGGNAKALLIYVGAFVLFAGAGSLFDSIFALPLVEIDSTLTIIPPADPAYPSIRRLTASLAGFLVFTGLLGRLLLPILRFLAHPVAPVPERVLAGVLTAPRKLGSFCVIGYGVVFLSITAVDLIYLRFPVEKERFLYVISTFAAMLATSIFLFTAVYSAVDILNRRFMIPLFFPDGMVSRSGVVKPMTFSRRLILLWIAVSLYPLIVLGLGYIPRDGQEGLQWDALIFILVNIPVGAFLILSAARSFQKPVKSLLKATTQIEAREFDLDLHSSHNDELGYLTDRVALMANSLRESEKVKDTFGRVVDPRVRDHLLKGSIELGGERMEAAVLFCDIRAFTHFSENQDEARVVQELNRHLQEMEACITASGGIINKFLGDGILALFGLPLASPSPALEALEAGCRMLERNRLLNRKRQEQNLAPWELGIGIHFGPVIAGNIGSASRMEYTVIGDTVNTASRIQELSKRSSHSLFFTQSVSDAIKPEEKSLQGNPVFLGKVSLRGKEQKIPIWTLSQQKVPVSESSHITQK